MMDRTRALEIAWTVVLVALLIVVFAIALGCKSTGALPCPETPVDVIDKAVPVPCIVDIALLPAAVLPPLPQHPGQDADEEERKAWALALGEAIEARMKILAARDAAWAVKVAEHNDSKPKCADVPVQPLPP